MARPLKIHFREARLPPSVCTLRRRSRRCGKADRDGTCYSKLYIFSPPAFNLSSNNTNRASAHEGRAGGGGLYSVLTAVLSLCAQQPHVHMQIHVPSHTVSLSLFVWREINLAANWTNFPLIGSSANRGCKGDDELKRSRVAQLWEKHSQTDRCAQNRHL